MATDEEGREFPDIPRPKGPEPKPKMRDAADEADRVFPDEEKIPLEELAAAVEPQDFVVVIAYRSTDGEVEEDFGKLVEDIKMLYTFKQDVRVWAVIEEAAKEVLSFVETPKEPKPANRVVLSYEPSDDDDPEELARIAEQLYQLFEAYPKLQEGLTVDPSVLGLIEKTRSTGG